MSSSSFQEKHQSFLCGDVPVLSEMVAVAREEAMERASVARVPRGETKVQKELEATKVAKEEA